MKVLQRRKGNRERGEDGGEEKREKEEGREKRWEGKNKRRGKGQKGVEGS